MTIDNSNTSLESMYYDIIVKIYRKACRHCNTNGMQQDAPNFLQDLHSLLEDLDFKIKYPEDDIEKAKLCHENMLYLESMFDNLASESSPLKQEYREVQEAISKVMYLLDRLYGNIKY